MKPTLILGLALAANTMATDSELFGFAVPQGKLGELARKYPGMIMYDEAADDELALALASRSSFKSDEEYRKYLFQMRTHMDDAADDELLVQPVKDLSRYRVDAFGKVLKDGIGRPLPPVLARFDEATDDELLLAFHDLPKYHQPDFHNLPKDEFGKVIRRPYTRLDEVADDELGVKIVHLPVAETMAYDDDELLVQPVKDLSRYRVDSFGKILKDGIGRPLPPVLARFDEVTDDELWVPDQYGRINQPDKYGRLYQPDQYGRMTGIPPVKKPIKPSHVFFDETADDELRIRPISVLPTAEPVAFDDELSFMPIPPKVFVNRDWVKPARIPTSEALIRDDEADDELAYLGQLINERPFARTFDDDELRVEKPSHLKAQEMTQMKSELPKMKRKFRPIIDEVPLAQN